MNAAKLLQDLPFKVLHLNAPLFAIRLPLRAMIVGVMEKKRLGHFRYGRFAARAEVSAGIDELQAAVRAYDLALFLGRYHAGTGAATDESCE